MCVCFNNDIPQSYQNQGKNRPWRWGEASFLIESSLLAQPALLTLGCMAYPGRQNFFLPFLEPTQEMESPVLGGSQEVWLPPWEETGLHKARWSFAAGELPKPVGPN